MASWQISLLLVFAFWTAMAVVQAVDSFVSMPESIDGVLIADVGDNISLTCNQSIGRTTVWRSSAPMECSGTIVHGIVQEDDCGQFTIRSLSDTSPFVSTAFANGTQSMTGSVVQCINSGELVDTKIGQDITLCILQADDPPSSLNLNCQVMSGGEVRCSWSAPDLPDCIMNNVSYSITITPLGENTTGVIVTQNTNNMEEIFMLEAGVTYQASVITNIDLTPPRQSEAVFFNFTAAETVPTTTDSVTSSPTDTGAGTTTAQPQTSSPSPPFWIWIIIVVVIVLVILGIIILIVFRKQIFKPCAKGGKEDTDHIALKQSSGRDSIKHEQAPGGEEYAVVDTTGRSKPTEDPGSFYQDPKAIEHEEAPTGDLYAVTERKPKKGSKKGPSEDELAQMYAQPDKSKKNQLTYADIDVSPGSGVAPHQPQLEYATVVN